MLINSSGIMSEYSLLSLEKSTEFESNCANSAEFSMIFDKFAINSEEKCGVQVAIYLPFLSQLIEIFAGQPQNKIAAKAVAIKTLK